MRVAQSIRETVRTVDFPARYGGEELAVIVPQIDPAALAAAAPAPAALSQPVLRLQTRGFGMGLLIGLLFALALLAGIWIGRQ